MSPIDRKLKALRMMRGLSLRALAARAGISDVALLKIERGDVSPRLDTVEALAAALGVSVGSLIETARTTPRAGGRLKRKKSGGTK